MRHLGPASRSITLACSALVVLAASARAQTTTLDEGVFSVRLGGRDVGTETFSIRRSGQGASAVAVAQSRIVLDGVDSAEEILTSVELEGPSLRPSAYQVNVRGPQPARIAGRMVGRRFTVRIVSAAGERMREYLAREAVALLDPDVAHPYYFVGRLAQAGSTRISLIAPRADRQFAATVTVREADPVDLSGRTVPARLLEVAVAGEGVRRVWIDAQGRVLRVEVPGRGYVAERHAVP